MEINENLPDGIVDISDMITLSSSDINVVYSGNLINATTNSPSSIAACIYNKSKSNIHLLQFEAFNQNINGELLFSTCLNQILQPGEKKDSPSILLEYTSAPYFVWTFEYEGKRYKAGHLWLESVIEFI